MVLVSHLIGEENIHQLKLIKANLHPNLSLQPHRISLFPRSLKKKTDEKQQF